MATIKHSIKEIQDKTIKIELEEVAQKGDQVVIERDQITTFAAVDQWLQTAVDAKYKKDILELQKKLEADHEQKLKTEKELAKLEATNTAKENFEKQLKAKEEEIAKKAQELIQKEAEAKSAVTNYKTSDEFLKLNSELNTMKEKLQTSIKNRENELALEHNKALQAKEEEINKLQKNLNEKLQKTEQELIKTTEEAKNAVDKYKTSDEFIKLNSELSKLREQLTEKLKSRENELKLEYSEVLKNKDEEINKLSNQAKEAVIAYKNSDEYKSLEKRLNDSLVEKSTMTEQHKLELQKAVMAKVEELKKIYDQNSEIKAKQIKEDTIKEQKEITENFVKEKNDEIQRLREENSDLKAKKSAGRNAKIMGNEFEEWCKTEIEDAFEDDEFIRLGTVKTSLEGKRADIAVDFLDKEKKLYKTAIIECKTEAADSTGKQKNQQFIDKLKKDAKSNKANLAILVTELEPSDIFTFRKHKDSTDELSIFMCRPEFLVEILRLYNIFYKKEVELKELEGLTNKNQNKISESFLEQFEEFRFKIEKAANYTLKKSEEINKNLHTILKKTTETQELVQSSIENKMKLLLKVFEEANPKFDKKFQQLLKSNIELFFIDDTISIDHNSQ